VTAKIIFHITQRQQWETAQLTQWYQAESLAIAGFIHCSTAKQLLKTANKFFAGQQGLVLLLIDLEKVSAEIKYELAEVEEEFPHIYGRLNVDAVVRVLDWGAGVNGKFELPEAIATFL
jgi:uncharacterized protein (DUF952 family)